MKPVAKYNLLKGASTVCTVGAPIITLLLQSEFFIHRTSTSISAAGMLAILIALLFTKDKIAENFKMPSAFVLSAILLIIILLVERILIPMKIVCIVTMITSGIDELTFKKFYKLIENGLPDEKTAKKHFGFLFTTSKGI